MSADGRGAAPVLFDMDGTLVDSRPGIVAALNATLAAMGLPEQPESALVLRIGPPIHDTWAELLRRPVEEVGDVVEAYRERYAQLMLDGTHVYPGIERLLKSLGAAGRLLAVATSKSQPIAIALLEHLGLDGHFAVVRGPVPPSTEEKAATVARTLEALGMAADAGAVLVGDRHHDVAGGHAHGLTVIGAGWGYGAPGELEEAGAEAVASAPMGVVPLLRGLTA